MTSLITRFRNELLDAGLNLKSSTITQEHDGTITVTAKLKPARLFIATLIALPCLYFLNYAISNPGIINLSVALFFCPALVLITLLIGGTISRKSIDPVRKQTTKSLRLFSFYTEASEPLTSHGMITLTWKLCTFQSGGGFNLYTITLSPSQGLVFETINDYLTARAFAERLATLLSFPLEDSVPQNKRS